MAERDGVLNMFPHICIICGKKYKTPKKDGKICSKKCMSKFFNKQITLICKVCGKKYKVQRPRVGKSSYCSYNCAHKGYINKKQYTCLQCGKVFLHYPSESGRKFCNKECKYKYLTGEHNTAWKGGLSFIEYPKGWNDKLKELVRTKFGNKCYLCGVPQQECLRKLDVHHIDGNKHNLELTNLVPLCQKCHGELSNKPTREELNKLQELKEIENGRGV